MVLGDLNFRLPMVAADLKVGTNVPITKDRLLNAVVDKLGTPDGRQKLAKYDPLTNMPDSSNPAWLVQSEEENGFAFTCNRPFEFYMPTYKLQKPTACSEMAKHVASHQTDVRTTAENHIRIKRCYEKDGELPLKGSQLQLGWLDRVCFRQTHGSSVKMDMASDEGWISSDAADHMAVAVTMQVSSLPRPTCCPAAGAGLPEHSVLAKGGGGSGPVIR